MSDFELSLLNSDAILKKGYKSIINNAGRAVALITLIVAVLVTFTDVGFVGGINQNVTGTVLLMLLASYLMYFSMESAGERLGRESDEYVSALGQYSSQLEKIKPADLYALREFCRSYSMRELDFRRESLLMKYGLTLPEYERFRVGGDAARSERRIYRRAARMKPRELTPSMLLSTDAKSGDELKSPEKTKLFTILLRLLPVTVSVFFTGALVLGAKDGLDAMTVIESIMKLSALPIIAIKGYVAGYGYAKDKERLWLLTKAKLLAAFLADAESRHCGKENEEEAQAQER